MAEPSSEQVLPAGADNEAAPPANNVEEEKAPTSPEEKVEHVSFTADDDEAPQTQTTAAPAAPTAGQDGDIMSVQSGASRSVATTSRMPRRQTITASTAPFDQSYRPSRSNSKFYCPPKQRQRWGDTQILPRTNW
jgi:hypothetical protein